MLETIASGLTATTRSHTHSVNLNVYEYEQRLSPAQLTWVGGMNANDWQDPANWMNNATPTINDDVIIPQGTTAVVTNGGVAKSVTIQGNANGIGTLIVNSTLVV
jgi:hypothetical protein